MARIAVCVSHKQSATGPVLFSVQHTSAPCGAYALRRYTDFEKVRRPSKK